MIKRNILFYAANIEPEIARIFKAYDQGNIVLAEDFKNKTVLIIDNILAQKDLSKAGHEEWYTIQNLILGYDKLDSSERKIALDFGQPFSQKFMNQLS